MADDKGQLTKLKPFSAIVLSFVAALGYGIFVRLAFTNVNEQLSGLFGLISIGFLFVVPLVLGFITIYFMPPEFRTRWLVAIFAPWVPCLIFAAIAAAFTWEVWICIVMALPIFLVMSTLGGIIGLIVIKSSAKPGRSQTSVVGLLLLAPFFITPLEKQLPAPE